MPANPEQPASARPCLRGYVIAGLALYPAWLAMMAIHEVGHVLHAWLSGGVVESVSVPLWGFSYTRLASNPAPGFVASGAAIWGAALPLFAWGAARHTRYRYLVLTLQLFAGWCLIANGVYLATALHEPVGDVADLRRAGAPLLAVGLIGVVSCIAGFIMWHRLRLVPCRSDA